MIELFLIDLVGNCEDRELKYKANKEKTKCVNDNWGIFDYLGAFCGITFMLILCSLPFYVVLRNIL